MRETFEKLTLDPYEIFSTRGENSIVIFPEIPFWVAVSKQGLAALEEMKRTGSIRRVAEKVLGSGETQALEEIKKFFTPLLESNVLYDTKISNNHKKELKPNKITFLQTMRCNLRCRHCCVADMPEQDLKGMSLETAKEILRRCITLMDEGKKGLSFLGGEPLCGDRFLELLDYATDLGYQIGLSTNGVLVDSKFAETAKRNNINVQISLDGTDESSHEYVRGKGTWDKAINALQILNEYDVDILNCLYNCYTYKGNMMYSLNIAKKEPIKARELSKLMYGITELFCNLTEEDLVTVTINLNSPGKVTVVLKEGYNKLKKGAIPLLAIYLFVFGGSGFGFEFPGLAKGIINTIEEYRTMETEVELKKEELKGKQLENYKAAMEVINMSKDTENDIDIDKVLKDLKLIDELNDSLKFESNIDFAKGIKESEE